MLWAFFAQPTYDDDESTRAARVLHACLMTSLATDVVGFVGNAVADPAGIALSLPIYAVVVSLTLGGVVALRRGWYRAVGIAYFVMVFAIANLVAWFFNGLKGGVVSVDAIVIVGAAIVFGRAGAIVSTVACAIGVIALEIGAHRGWVLDMRPDGSPAASYLVTGMLLAGLMIVADRVREEALGRMRAARDHAEQQTRALEVTRDALDDVLTAMADALIVVDEKGVVIRTNPALIKLFGRGDFLGLPVSELFAGPATEGEVLIPDVDGEQIAVAASRGRGRVGEEVWVLRDVRHRREAERRLREAAEAAESASRAKSQFLANMSHELRTPLNAIIGYSEMIREDHEDAALQADVTKIESAGRHLLSLISDILDLSKIEAGKMEFVEETVYLGALAADIAEVVRPMADRNGNRLEIHVTPDAGELRSDGVRVKQVLLNLLSNAAKFTENGTVSLQVDGDAERVRFTVRDTGIGIAPETLERLFRPFTQADGSTTRRYGGTGLGLALVASFTQMMGGDISAHSVPGQGSTFIVTLPRTPSRGEGSSRPTMEGAIVLAIDDDPSVHEILARTLLRRGITLVSAMTGREGLELARKIRPRAITLDVMMPGMDGFEVLAALKADPITRDIPVAVVSIVDGEVRGKELGAAAWLLKPIDRRRLVEALERLIGTPRDILVVDDDDAQRELVARLLREGGAHVRTANDGRSALEELRRLPPQAVILDLRMPGMDGFQLLEAMRADPALAQIGVVVLTAAELGADDRDRVMGVRVVAKGPSADGSVLDALRALDHGPTVS